VLHSTGTLPVEPVEPVERRPVRWPSKWKSQPPQQLELLFVSWEHPLLPQQNLDGLWVAVYDRATATQVNLSMIEVLVIFYRHWLGRAKIYRLPLPPNAPVKNFWSMTIYDVNTRTPSGTKSRSQTAPRA